MNPIALSLFCLPFAVPQEDDSLVSSLEEHIATEAEQDRFSGAVLVARDDEILFQKAYGLASKRFDVPNRIDTKFNLGSMNKMFTGVAICQLVEAGKLSFEDRIVDHVPDYPNREVAEKVTIHQLLTHTSGLGSFWNEKFEARWRSLRTVEDHIPLFAEDPLQFEPGSRFGYSNAGPVVLGLIIERVTGQSYYDYVREKIYAPAGMKDTDCYAMDEPVPNLAIGYTQLGADGHEAGASAEWRNNYFLHRVKGGPAGGGFSTVGDLFRFARALQEGVLLSVEMTETLLTGKVSMGMGGAEYAYLFGDHGDGMRRFHGHNGGAPGISAVLSFYPESGFTVCVLSNYDGCAMPIASYARNLVEEGAEAELGLAPGARATTEPTGASPVGSWSMETRFQGQAIPATLVIEEKEGELSGVWRSQGGEMKLTGLEVEGSQIRFSRTMGPGGPPMAFEGELAGDTIEGAFTFQGRELECSGKRSG